MKQKLVVEAMKSEDDEKQSSEPKWEKKKMEEKNVRKDSGPFKEVSHLRNERHINAREEKSNQNGSVRM